MISRGARCGGAEDAAKGPAAGVGSCKQDPYFIKNKGETSVVKETDNLDLGQIAESGQCFRWQQLAPGTYGIPVGKRYLTARQKGRQIQLSCPEEEWEVFWKSYLDWDTDYGWIQQQADKNDPFLQQAIRCGRGIRLLRQDLWEVVASFVISQNNNIPRIKGCIERLCRAWGDWTAADCPAGGFYTFPAPERLAAREREDLAEAGLGYRDRYLLAAARWFQGISDCEKQKLGSRELLAVPGIGIKVASCICLYGLHDLSVCPVDVWVKRIIEEVYQGVRPRWMDSPWAGVYQQYCFVYERFRKGAGARNTPRV